VKDKPEVIEKSSQQREKATIPSRRRPSYCRKKVYKAGTNKKKGVGTG